jgi:hypothetical protein
MLLAARTSRNLMFIYFFLHLLKVIAIVEMQKRKLRKMSGERYRNTVKYFEAYMQ